EFEKRGLPHAHICIFLDAKDKFPSVGDIDRVICAEIPDKENDPQLFQLVSDFMIHGPCGVNNPTCPCMRDGPDRVTAAVYEGNKDDSVHGTEAGVDEIKEYYNCRYISACEATWRIFSFDIHYRYPSVERLSFHLPGEQNIFYEDDADLCDVLNKPTVGSSMFMAWM
ncbi:hypothetical protein Tco_0051079, partial [Tanacetum coccineum]